MKPRSRFSDIAWILMLAAVVGGCSKEAGTVRRLNRAIEEVGKGDYTTAEIGLKNVLKGDPANAGAMKALGIIRVKQGSALEGVGLLSAAKSAFADDEELQIHLALGLLELGFFADSRKEILDLLDRHPDHGEAMMILAETSLIPDWVDECGKRIEASGGGKPEILLASAVVALRRGEIEKASMLVEEALVMAPDLAKGHALQANILKIRNRPEQALASLRKAAELSLPRGTEPLLLSRLLVELERPDEAVEILLEVIGKTPDYLGAWRTLARISFDQGDEEKAGEQLGNVLRRSPLDLEGSLLQSEIWIRNKEASKAVELLGRVTGTFPSRPSLELAFAKACLADNQAGKAAGALERALAIAPNLTEAASLRAGLYLKNKDYDAAIRLLEDASKEKKAGQPVEDLLVQAYRAAGRPEEATALLEKRIRSAPGDTGSLIRLGEILRAQGKLADARATFGTVLEIEPDNLVALSQLVEIELQDSNRDMAEQRVDGFLKDHPDSAAALVLKAGIESAKGAAASAESLLEKAISLEPGEPGAYRALARLKVADGKTGEAVALLERLSEVEPDHLETALQLGYHQRELGHAAKSREAFERAIAISPDFAPAYNNIAVLESEDLGDLDRALEHARKARELDPRSAAISDTLGWIHWQRKEYREALPLLQEAAAGLHDVPAAHYRLGMARYMMGQSDEAIPELERALSLPGEFKERPEAEDLLEKLRSSGESDVASLERHAEADPSDTGVLLALGKGLQKAGRVDEAIGVYQRALEANPDLEAAYLGLSDIYARLLNQPDKALEAASKARSIAPLSARAAAAAGYATFLAGDHVRAYGLLKEATDRLSGDAGVRCDYAWAAYSIGMVDQARKAMEEVAQSDRDQAGEAATFLWLTGPELLSDPDAGARVDGILAAHPDQVPALMAKGRLLEETGGPAAAIYAKALVAYEHFDPARKALARLYLADPGKLGSAEKLVRRARERSGGDQELTAMLGVISYRKGEHAEAVRLLKESSLRREPTAGERFALGMSQAAVGDKEEARINLEKAMSGDIGDDDRALARGTSAALDAGSGE